MHARRRHRKVMIVATCLLSLPLAIWVVRHSHSGGVHLQAAGEEVHADVTPPLTLARWPQALPTATPGEEATAWPDSADAEGASPMVVPVAPPTAAPPAETPQAAPFRPHDVVPPRGPIAAVLEARTRGDLQQLDALEDGAGNPMERVAALLTFLEQQQCAGGACQAAQRVTEAYLRARAALLRDMLEAFLASAGEYDGAREHQALRALHADFTAEMATLTAHVPMLVRLPDILATTLRVPDYLEAPADDPRVRP